MREQADDEAVGARTWWQDMVLYEVHLPSYRDGNGDGIGDLHGLVESLDYLRELGVTAIWTGPFYRSPLLDQGFDITDHRAVEAQFGSLDTVAQLVEAAHARGIRVIADFVPNHTSDQHPWFEASRSSRISPKRDWYIWADAREGRDYPNNWTSEAGGSVWEYDEGSGQFYLHSHLKEQPDLNWRNPQVRAAQHDVLRFWLNRGIDGFRIDVAHMLAKDPELRDNPPNPHGRNDFDIQHPDFDSQMHVYDRMHPDLHAMLAEIRTVVDSYPGDRVTIGEIQTMGWAEWRRYFGTAGDELHLPFAFKLIETEWVADALMCTISELDAALPEGAWPIFALGNHDRSRLATRLGRDQARVAAMLLLTLRGTPTMFYGDELGLVDQEVPPSAQRDYFGLTADGVSRDPSRTPMPWHDGPNAGFSDADISDLWLPISHEFTTINVKAQRRDPGSLLRFYSALLALRRGSRALTAGSWEASSDPLPDCVAYYRRHGDEEKLVVLNVTGVPQRGTCSDDGVIVLSTNPERVGEAVNGVIELDPNEGIIVNVVGRDRA